MIYFWVRFIKAFLVKEGFEVDYLENGEGVYELVKRKRPDIVVLDIIMPVKDGFAVLEELKADDLTKSIPVLVLTMLSGDSDREKIMRYGITKYVTKPHITFKEVIKEIKSVL